MGWHDIVKYDQNSGRLYWVKRFGSRAMPGGQACGFDGRYMYFRLNKKKYYSHRVIWDLNHPEDPLKPGDEIDHIDHDKTNNRTGNLRKVSKKDNMKNLTKPIDNTSGAVGVSFDKSRNKWMVRVNVNYKTIHIGRFSDFEEAVKARRKAEIQYGFHENHGKEGLNYGL